MQELNIILKDLDEIFSVQQSYTKYKNRFLKVSTKFYEFYKSEEEIKILLMPLEAYIKKGNSLFKSKTKPKEIEIQKFLDLTKTTLLFWKDTLEEYTYLMDRTKCIL